MPAEKRRESSAALASFVQDVSFDDIPPSGVALVEDCFIDTIGVTIAGTTTEAGSIAYELVERDAGGSGGARLLGSDVFGPCSEAAFAMGVAGHALDFDDYTMAVPGHTSVTIIPAILALAGSRPVSGADAIAAYVAGFETQYFIGTMIKPDHYTAGWHATSTLGTFGAAAAAARLLELDAERTRNALAIAASTAAGIRQNFGTMTKPMHAGYAARSGLFAAQLAELGFTGARDAIDGEYGFLRLYGGESIDRNDPEDLGRRWAIAEDGIILKKYPTCGASHTPLEAASTLIRTHEIDSEDIERVIVKGSPRLTDIMRYENPETGYEAKFSLKYAVACMFARGAVTVDDFEAARVADPAVEAVRSRVEFVPDREIPYYSSAVEIGVETAAGDTFVEKREVRPGSPESPLTDDEIADKFATCCVDVFDESTARTALEVLTPLRDLTDVGQTLDSVFDRSS